MKTLAWAGFVVFLATPAARSAGDKGRPAEFECRWAASKITIDGKADEEAWKSAQTIDLYVPWDGARGRAARSKGAARLLWDREYIYFFAEMEDADLFADVKEHDGMLWENDVFELFFRPDAGKPGYYEFQINPLGTTLDMFLPRRNSGGYRRFKSEGQFHMKAAVQLRGTLNNWRDKDEGWSAEGRIPWKDFMPTGGRPNPGEHWKFALCRFDYSVAFEGPEMSTCAPLKVQDFHHLEDYADLKFIGPAKDARRDVYRRVPVTTSRVVGSPDPPPPFRPVKAYPGLKIDYPVAVVHQPGSDRLIFCTQDRPYSATTLWRMKDDPGDLQLEKLVEQDAVTYDFAFHPNFKNNGYFYIGCNAPASNGKTRRTQVIRYVMERRPPYRLDLQSAKVVIDWPSDGHNGGAIAFGLDGMMYVTSGDGTSDSDTNLVGQDTSSLLAKVLRIDVDHPDPGKTYAVPRDNPFAGLQGARPEIWCYGLRNPWRMTVDRKTGHIWVGQNGQDLWEQAFLIEKGANYGWSVMEGSHPFYLQRRRGPTPFVKPTVEHPHSEFRSLTGGIVYYGKRLPELNGAYIYGDYSTGQIWAVRHDGKKTLWHKKLADTRLQITGFGVDARGELLICDHRGGGQGSFYTLERQPMAKTHAAFPRTLSESGLFRSVRGHQLQPGLIPYAVNAPLWGDKAFKKRWIALPGDGKIDYSSSRGWGFPDGTVIVKSFGLEMEEGNPASRRWIETRFLTNQKGEWFGYSYAWNDEQTEGYLVDGKGMDRKLAIKVPASGAHLQGTREQIWHFPSRTECLICHSRAANWVLGLTTLQLNRLHEDLPENQLSVLEKLEVLRVNWVDEARQAMREELRAHGHKDGAIEATMRRHVAAQSQRQPAVSFLLALPPEKYQRLVDPYDRKNDLALRARSYLHSNCAQCHVEAGGGNAMIDLEFGTPLEKMRVLDVKPQHHTFSLPDARLIAPGQPERSVLLYRMAQRGEGRMPPLATSLVDEPAVELIREWIRRMKAGR
jgi:glucose/arabinose dehydrogenase/mono/diheme cytochrome c family protein